MMNNRPHPGRPRPVRPPDRRPTFDLALRELAEARRDYEDLRRSGAGRAELAEARSRLHRLRAFVAQQRITEGFPRTSS